MITVIIQYQEEITEPIRTLRYDNAVVEGLKMFHKLHDLKCAYVEVTIKTFGPGVHVESNKIG